MARMKKLKNRIPFVLSLIMIMIAMGMQFAFAEVMPDLIEDNGTLRVKVQYTDEDKVTDITGTELAIYKVADLTVKNGDPRYHLTEDFSSVDVDFNGMTAADAIKAAELFNSVVTEKGLEGKKAVSQNGIADFGEVSHGMYLVVQTGATGDATGYIRINPYLVMAPQPLTDIGENMWEYEVESIPKMVMGVYEPPKEEKKEEVRGKYEDEKVKSAKTGDETNLYVWVALIPLALSAMIIVGMNRKRNRDTN